MPDLFTESAEETAFFDECRTADLDDQEQAATESASRSPGNRNHEADDGEEHELLWGRDQDAPPTDEVGMVSDDGFVPVHPSGNSGQYIHNFVNGLNHIGNMKMRLEQIQQQLGPEPDRQYDPAAWVEWRENARQVQQYQQQIQHNILGHVNEHLSPVLQAGDNDMRQQHADYDDAVDFIGAKRIETYRAQGMSPQQAEQALAQEAVQFSMQCIMEGKDPARILYNLAKVNGFKGRRSKGRSKSTDKMMGTNSGLDGIFGGQDDSFDTSFNSFWQDT